ncbi:DNA topoisomerase 1 [Podila clonocystis]|nr:DNA topoisomerase 1 [Podila clonocystis]
MSDSEDMPLAQRTKKLSKDVSSGSDSDVPLGKRKKLATKKIIRDEDSGEDSEEAKPLAKRTRPAASYKEKDTSDDSDNGNYSGKSNNKNKSSPSNRSSSSLSDGDDSSDSDVPLAKKKAPAKPAPAPKANGASRTKTAPKYKEESSDSDSDIPLAKKAPKKTTSKSSNDVKVKREPESKSTTKKRVKDESETNGKVKKIKKEDPEPTKPLSKKVKKEEPETNGKPKKVKKEESEDEDENAWWKNQNENEDDTVKWSTLHHNGVYFPPDYVPHGIKMKYDGKPIKLAPEVEEIASFFAALLFTEHAENPTFQQNFFRDFSKIARKAKTEPEITSFKKCDFTPMYDHFQKEKEKKKSMTKEQKQALKNEKDELDKHYGTCLLNGRKEKVGNYRIEPPGLFRGRGKHPKTGALKFRVQPEQVTLNLSKDAPVPKAPAGHKWAKIVHDDTKTWLATWKENVNDSTKYVFLAAGSSLKGQSDLKKFETARSLKKEVDGIRKGYMTDLKDKKMVIRQRATAMYLIDRLALRAGNEKGEDEADTVGCCSLRYEHVTLEKPNIMHLDFLGKDSIRYEKSVEVDDQVFKNIRLFKREPAQEGDDLFDRLKTSDLNKHLQNLMPGLTAKVFRTFNASFTFQDQLQKLTPKDGNVAEKLLAYNRANREVAVLCNHQRAVSKGHAASMEKIEDKIRAFKYQKWKTKLCILHLEPKLKKKRPELLEPESDMEDEWIDEHEAQLIEKEKEKAQQKFEKENLKRAENKESKLPASELKEWLKEVDEHAKRLKKERKSGVVEGSKGATVEKCDAKLLALDDKIAATRTAMIDKEENKQTALGTSKINYIDPRISAAWCQKYDVPLEKIFTKTLRDKFKWAMTVDPDWEF